MKTSKKPSAFSIMKDRKPRTFNDLVVATGFPKEEVKRELNWMMQNQLLHVTNSAGIVIYELVQDYENYRLSKTLYQTPLNQKEIDQKRFAAMQGALDEGYALIQLSECDDITQELVRVEANRQLEQKRKLSKIMDNMER